MLVSLKIKIKNDLWRMNYILPFVKKHQFDEKGKAEIIRHVFRAYKEIRPVRGKGTVGSDTKAILSKVDIEFQVKSQFIYFIDTKKTLVAQGSILSNFTLDYSKIVYGSFAELVLAASGDDAYGQEAKQVAEGVSILVERVIDALGQSEYPKETKARLRGYFGRILTTKAEHFDEALQRILFFNQIMWQTRHRLNGLGRLDKMLGDLYEEDKRKGVLTEEAVHDIVFDFLTQLSRYAEYKSDALEGDIGQIIILGGLEHDGTYFYNGLTSIFLQEQANLKKPDPKTMLRVSKNMPEKLLREAVRCLLSKTGSPLFSNDDVVIPTLLDFGMPSQDAYDYCTSACWEPFIVGKSLDQNNISVFDYFSALDEVLGKETSSFENLIDSYNIINERKFQEFLSAVNQLKWARDPLVSMFTEGCSEKRQDITDGACKYRDYGITTVALANVVDSLFQIKRLVFDEERYSLTELNEIRKKNFEGYDKLYQELQRARKHYGHDDQETVELVKRLESVIGETAKRYRNMYDGTVKIGLSSPGYNILSKKTAADFSGRKAGMPYSTHISCSDAPYTEVVNFAGQLDYKGQKFNGNVVDFFVPPTFLEDNFDKFILFMQGAVRAGFFQMQMNILDSKTLMDAKEHPEKYAGLIVRVWGFSAYFNELPESYKDLLIERAVAAEKIV